jgi:hypothetical protein
MFEVAKRIEEFTERQKELVLQCHNLRETIERADATRDQLKQAEKEIAWLAGTLETLKVWQAERDENDKMASAATN